MKNDQISYEESPLIIHGAIGMINSMKDYRKKVPVLVPFDFYNLKTKTKKIERKEWWSYLFIDSGAFSVSQNNAKIELKNYIKFIKENEDQIDHYASLDVVGDGEQSLENWKVMRKEGLFPIPVFHDGEPLNILKEYIDGGSTYIGLGAVAFKSKKSRLIFFDRIFDLFPNRKEVGFHGFGVFDFGFLKRYPWRSIDSSAVSALSRYGHIIIGEEFRKWNISKKRELLKAKRGVSEYGEEFIKNKFKQYNLSYEKAIRKDKEGMLERIFFNLEAVEEYVKIPSEFDFKLKLISLL